MASFVPPAYQPPTVEEIQQSPDYQFRLNQGNEALNRSAAARGTLRSGGTLKDILEYGQNFASQELGAARDRYRQDYQPQYQAALDKWKADWDMHVYNTTPRGGGGRSPWDDLPPPPEAPGGDPYGPEPYPGDPGYGDPGANPWTPEEPFY